MSHLKHKRLSHLTAKEFAERNEEYFGSLGISSLSVIDIGYDLRHSLDLVEQEHSMSDLHNDVEGSDALFMDLSEGAFETDRRINGRLSASFCFENSLTRCYKRHM